MWKTLTSILSSFLSPLILGVKIKLLSFVLKSLRGVRKIMLLTIMAMGSLMMATLGLFTSVAYSLFQYTMKGEVRIDAVLIFTTLTFIIFSFLIAFFMSERLWLKALKIDDLLKELQS